jgi:hypothetical protein
MVEKNEKNNEFFLKGIRIRLQRSTIIIIVTLKSHVQYVYASKI